MKMYYFERLTEIIFERAQFMYSSCLITLSSPDSQETGWTKAHDAHLLDHKRIPHH